MRVTSPADRPLGWAPTGALVAGVLAAAALAVGVDLDGERVATFWPASGLGVVLLALSPLRRWAVLVPLLAATVVCGDLVGGRELGVAVPHGLAEAITTAAAAAVLTDRGRRRPHLEDHEQFVRLLAAAATSGGLVALGGLATAPFLDLSPLGPTLAVAFAAHTAGVLLVVPLALARRTPWAGRGAELAGQAVLLVGASLLTFIPEASSALTFAPVLLLAWAALRFDLRVATVQTAVFGALVTAQTVIATGPFGDGVTDDRTSALVAAGLTQGYLAAAALLVLPLGIAVQRNRMLLDRITADGRLFRRNFTESLVGMAFLEPDPTGRDLVVVDLNETALGILGGDEERLLGMRLRDIVDPGPAYAETLPRLLDGSSDGWRVEGPLLSRDSGYVTLHLSALGTDDGDAPLFAAQLLDVTAEHDARHGLEAAQTLTNATLDTTNCIIMVTDVDGVVVRVNQATSAITGWGESELLGRKVWDTGITPAEADDAAALFAGSALPLVREADALTRSGEKLRIVWNTSTVSDEHGTPMYAVMTGIDVTAERTTAGLVNHLMEASLTTAIVGIDTVGRISVANSGLQHLLGYEREELVGEPFHKLLKTSELLERTGAETPHEAFDILVRGLGRDGETRARDWTWVSRSGGEQLVSMTLSVAQDTFAARTGYLCVARDVTEQRHSQEMLMAALDKERTAVERLRSLDLAKNEFVSTVSHELRTPVTSIVGYTEMLSDGTIVEALPDQKPLLETINRNGQRLIAMINDLLMLSGLDSDTVQWRHDPVDLAATVGPIEESIRPLLSGRRLTLEVERPDGPVNVLGDRAQLERVMINLLSNAVKFTEDGGTVSFAVGTAAEDSGEEHAVIRVRDTGIGIPAEEQEELFQRFFRSSTAQVRQIQGTGLGLSIVHAIVSGHGGSIEVESAHMQGSVFTVRLPLVSAPRLAPVGKL